MKTRERPDPMRLRDTTASKRRHFGILICWCFALSLAQLPAVSEALADGDASNRSADTGSTGDGDVGGSTRDSDTGGDRGPSDTHVGDTAHDGGGSQPVQGDSEDREDTDQENVRNAVAEGRVLPLKNLLTKVDPDRYGTIIAVDLRRYKDKDIYRLKTRDEMGVIRELRINARTGKFINIFGF